jgi:hypothetical protein
MGMPPLLPEVPRPTRKPNYRPVLLTILCSFLLGAGSCFGFLTTLSFNHNVPINGVFAVGFCICLLVFLGSILWLAIKAVRDGIKERGDAP